MTANVIVQAIELGVLVALGIIFGALFAVINKSSWLKAHSYRIVLCETLLGFLYASALFFVLFFVVDGSIKLYHIALYLLITVSTIKCVNLLFDFIRRKRIKKKLT